MNFTLLIAISGTVSGSGYCVEVKRDGRAADGIVTEALVYIFEKLMPEHGYSLRTEQLELAKDILEALRCRVVSLSEAGVGIGKTHAYLIAAAIIKRSRVNDFWLRSAYPGMAYIAEMPILAATSSIALQKAIVKDYIPEISKILKLHGIITKPLSCVIRKGKEHYVCEKRLRLLYEQTKRDAVKSLLEPLVRGKGGIDLDEMDNLDAYIKRRINVTGRCSNCNYRGSCHYIAFLRDVQSDKYDFQICNHNYLLADVMHRARGQQPLIPHYQAIVIDEAHKFLQAARSMYGLELSSLTMLQLAKTIRGFVFEQGQSTAELWRDTDKLDGQAKRLFRVLTGNIPDIYTNDDADRFKTEIDEVAERHIRNIRGILERITDRLKERKVVQKYERLYSNALWKITDLYKQLVAFEKHGDLIYWLEKPDGLYSSNDGSSGETLLCAIPKTLGDMLHTDIWSKGIPVILTSGTLSASGQGLTDDSFTHVKLGMGLDKLKPGELMESSRQSPFNYYENSLIYISNNVPFPDYKNPRYVPAVADEMERLITAAHGHTVALFTSYRVMESVFDLLKKRSLPFPLFILGRGSLNAIDRFRHSGNGVLFAAGSMWEGIDLPGDILSLLIIVKLPFDVPDPLNDYEQSRYGSPEKFKNAVIIPSMVVRNKQGVGRLLRTVTDTGVCTFFDIRMREGAPYHNIILRSLPDCPVTSDCEVVRDFYLDKKSTEYFNDKIHP